MGTNLAYNFDKAYRLVVPNKEGEKIFSQIFKPANKALLQ